ncbi:hypothetical protein LTS18_011587, partial [Coniosporium uncinatum]
NKIEKVAVVGAGGNLGKHFVEELLKTGKHTITAITRPDSQTTLPPGVKRAAVNYDDESSHISALRDQDFFIITLSVTAPTGTHTRPVAAAAKAGVPYIMPNTYGYDTSNASLVAEIPGGKNALGRITEVQNAGVSFVSLTCGFWYEWSLALGEQWYGFDIKERKVTLIDDGKTRIVS